MKRTPESWFFWRYWGNLGIPMVSPWSSLQWRKPWPWRHWGPISTELVLRWKVSWIDWRSLWTSASWETSHLATRSNKQQEGRLKRWIWIDICCIDGYHWSYWWLPHVITRITRNAGPFNNAQHSPLDCGHSFRAQMLLVALSWRVTGTAETLESRHDAVRSNLPHMLRRRQVVFKPRFVTSYSFSSTFNHDAHFSTVSKSL